MSVVSYVLWCLLLIVQLPVSVVSVVLVCPLSMMVHIALCVRDPKARTKAGGTLTYYLYQEASSRDVFPRVRVRFCVLCRKVPIVKAKRI